MAVHPPEVHITVDGTITSHVINWLTTGNSATTVSVTHVDDHTDDRVLSQQGAFTL